MSRNIENNLIGVKFTFTLNFLTTWFIFLLLELKNYKISS